jgi:hypothetical protein
MSFKPFYKSPEEKTYEYGNVYAETLSSSQLLG